MFNGKIRETVAGRKGHSCLHCERPLPKGDPKIEIKTIDDHRTAWSDYYCTRCGWRLIRRRA